MTETNPRDEPELPQGMPDFEAPTGSGWGSLGSPAEASPPAWPGPAQPGRDGFAPPGGAGPESPYLAGYEYRPGGGPDPVVPPYQPPATAPGNSAQGGSTADSGWQMATNPWQSAPTGGQSAFPPPQSRAVRRVQPPPPAPGPPDGENIMRGLLMAGLGVVAAIALAVVLAMLGVWTAFAAWLMATVAIWLYGKGAGTPPAKGTVPLLIVLGVGTVLTFFAAVGTEIWRFGSGYPTGERVAFTLRLLFSPDILSGYLGLGLLLVIFGALGAVPLFRALGRRA